MTEPTPEQKNKLLSTARDVLNNSHSPYSKFKVASSVLTEGDQVYPGVNVENASYGGTICAERTAIFNAVTFGSKKIKAILVLTNEDDPWPPCGFCRQVMAEFANANAPIYLANMNGIQKEFTLGELLPQAFGPQNL